MIISSGAIPVEYAVDKVFSEATKTKHLPKSLGIVSLCCREELLRRNTNIQAKIALPIPGLGMKARIAEFEENKSIYISGSSRHAELGLSFDFQDTGIDSTNVEYNFELHLKSNIARIAEGKYGRDNTHNLIGNVVMGIVTNVHQGLELTYGSSLMRPA